MMCFKTNPLYLDIGEVCVGIESEEQRIDWGSDKSNQFSDELKCSNQQILEDAEVEIIMSESECSSDI